MKELFQKGIERKLYENTFPSLSPVQCKVSSFRPVGFNILIIVFEILAAGCGMAILFLIVENIVKQLRRFLK